MNRWAEENGVDRSTISVCMKVERLLQIRRRIDEIKRAITDLQDAKDDVRVEFGEAAPEIGEDEADEESTQLDSEIGDMRRGLQNLRQEEQSYPAGMKLMGGELRNLQQRPTRPSWENGRHIFFRAARSSALAGTASHFWRTGRSASALARLQRCDAFVRADHRWHLRRRRRREGNGRRSL